MTRTLERTLALAAALLLALASLLLLGPRLLTLAQAPQIGALTGAVTVTLDGGQQVQGLLRGEHNGCAPLTFLAGNAAARLTLPGGEAVNGAAIRRVTVRPPAGRWLTFLAQYRVSEQTCLQELRVW